MNNELENLKAIINEILESANGKRGRLSGKTREFDKHLSHLSNQQLIEISSYISHLIETTDEHDDLLGSLLDNVLENITGTR